ncbi:tRNA uridine-5-carboxymethylaminomethyl(34) synthesis GTPase MnmE [Odoribacter sp. OttesenSCG-928-J03]|nr:tRNA uridine-5-carboxymethylaminomethyl(34) synthesis GTPase MnmE [Odoribacter sp. OttesenSCG-928-J03]MDL2282933.1 tRNA uridine-5-carboxymethylaminomethyl(34) synthesis GTPase MnmE [Odoribacter sp. OttesenSCG-928-G04]
MTDKSVICAISTAPGMGAIALLRLSGEGAIELTDQIFKSITGKKLSSSSPNRVYYGEIYADDEVLDEVLVTVFRAPHSFTGEDLIEISCHGSVYIQQRILQLLILSGARLANPGEFTQRAFLNGKMDLSQAEAVADLIASSSAASHRMAISQMKGTFSEELRKLRSEMLQIITLLELELDFSEEDVEFAERTKLLDIANHIKKLLTRLSNSFSLGNVIKNGVPVAIVGNTNVGKSTLLNTLLNEEKAIVSDIAGTTRDVIEDTINLNGITFRFIDTAGIRATSDEIESMGIERTFAKIEQANVVLLITDLSRGIESFEQYYNQVKAKIDPTARLIIVLNKTDKVDDILTQQETIRLLTSGEEIIPISAKTGYNVPLLIEELTDTVNSKALNSADVIVSNVRHYEALIHAREAIERAIGGLESAISGEFVSQDIRECLHYIGEITGEISTDEVLGEIFKGFCIGK